MRVMAMSFRVIVSALRSRRDLIFENLALRQQLAAFMTKQRKPTIRSLDRAFWVMLRQLWSRWAMALVIVKPETVVRGHREGFRLFWKTFLRNHRIAPAGSCSRSARPSHSIQLRGTSSSIATKHFSQPVIDAVVATGAAPKRIGFRAPWQNGVAERWVGTCRRELLEHVILINEAHLRRLLREYIDYYHDDRTHCGHGKQSPRHRATERAPPSRATVAALPRVGGLHHRYHWHRAAYRRPRRPRSNARALR
jgi:integrase-like protein